MAGLAGVEAVADRGNAAAQAAVAEAAMKFLRDIGMESGSRAA
jgi:hypothetical protein